MPVNPRTKRNTKSELGRQHQKNRARLLSRLVPGDVCWWCGEVLHKDSAQNWDGHPLAADHELARANGGIKASRLLHLTCNSQRGDGSRDDQRPTLTGRPYVAPSAKTDADDRAQWCLLDWN